MEYTLEFVIALFVAVIGLGLLANKLRIPYPIALVIGGLCLGFVPGIPKVTMDPDLIFFTILPPLLFSGGYFTSVGAFRSNLLPIILLALGLVLITTIGVAVYTHYVDHFEWAIAFILGAIVSPPDAIAAMAITQRLKVNHHLVTIIDGESLVNDAGALVIYRIALAALATGTFSLLHASLEFVAVCVGGIAFGLLFGVIASRIVKYISEPSLVITFSLLLPYFSYLVANQFYLSGVLSAVTTGIYMGWRIPLVLDPMIRIEMGAVWRMYVFLLNGIAFILIGLQLPTILQELRGYPKTLLIAYAVMLNLLIIAIRFGWVFLSITLPRYLKKKWRESYHYLDFKHSLVISWCGMRGVVSLAAALALPLILGSELVPDRSMTIFLTFSVIFTSLVLQGLTLPYLIRKLGLAHSDTGRLEEAKVRMRTSQAAIERLKQLTQEEGVEENEVIEQLKMKYEDQISWANRIISNIELSSSPTSTEALQLELLRVEREKIIRLRNEGLISGDVANRILNDIDLEAVRLHQKMR